MFLETIPPQSIPPTIWSWAESYQHGYSFLYIAWRLVLLVPRHLLVCDHVDCRHCNTTVLDCCCFWDKEKKSERNTVYHKEDFSSTLRGL